VAVVLETTIHRYIGLSTDAKPRSHRAGSTTDAAETIPAGSSFLESDTGRIFRWSGEEWLCPDADTEGVQLLRAVRYELAEIRKLLLLNLA